MNETYKEIDPLGPGVFKRNAKFEKLEIAGQAKRYSILGKTSRGS